ATIGGDDRARAPEKLRLGVLEAVEGDAEGEAIAAQERESLAEVAGQELEDAVFFGRAELAGEALGGVGEKGAHGVRVAEDGIGRLDLPGDLVLVDSVLGEVGALLALLLGGGVPFGVEAADLGRLHGELELGASVGSRRSPLAQSRPGRAA